MTNQEAIDALKAEGADNVFFTPLFGLGVQKGDQTFAVKTEGAELSDVVDTLKQWLESA